MNIILEDGINFYDELNKLDDDISVNEDDDICLLSHMHLDKNHIKLKCNHSFNFEPLFKEVCKQKCGKSINLEIDKVKYNQIKCPYCRKIHDHLLPNIKINSNISFIYGVNIPSKYCMSFHKCDYVLKTGKNKGKSCDSYGYYYNDNCYCKRHHSIKQVTKPLKLTCKCLLKTGKRKGEECGSKIHEGEYCKRHSKISST
jgi:hypothetical protein